MLRGQRPGRHHAVSDLGKNRDWSVGAWLWLHAAAIAGGVNYFDTAYMYPGSEATLGRVLRDAGLREKVYIASKIPPSMIYSRKDMEKVFTSILERLQTGYLDFLLCHAVNDLATWLRLKALGWPEFVADLKKSGKLRFAGFSWHGSQDEFLKVVDDHDWDFCMIQYNYLDEFYQAGRAGLEHAASKGLGIVIMEPLRGGSLVGRMPTEVKAVMEASPVQRTPAAWALDWLWDQPQVNCVLSGLNDEAHIAENLALASASRPGMLNADDQAALRTVRDAYQRLMKVGCTGCQYCMPCPFGVDIPYAFSVYNAKYLFSKSRVRFQYRIFTSGMGSGIPSGADLCRQCGICVPKCPQHIDIPTQLAIADKELAVAVLKPAMAIMRFVVKMRGKKKEKA